ncbi:MAG: M81 family peptidase [Alphaproteobacteria bacterium]|nr:M81 family peptidase [Alphaproteobacteria bacterium]
MAKRLAIAKFAHESNSFTPGETCDADFHAYGWHRGDEAAVHYSGTRTSIGAAIDFLGLHPEWQETFLICTAANPAGPVADATFERIMGEILGGLRGQTWDAVYLCLHGAMLRAGNPKADEEIIDRVRQVVGRTPIGVSYDLHGNLGEAQVKNATVAVGYKTHPHVDMYETTEKTLRLLIGTVEGRFRPVGAFARVEALLPSFNMRTTGDGPMAELEAIAAEAEKRHGLLDVTVFGGFPYADTPYAGGSVMVHADGDAALAERVAREVAAEALKRAPRFQVELPSAEEAIRQALASPPGVAVVLENSDNPGSGGIGDTTGLFGALMVAKPKVPTAFAFFRDEALVAKAHAAGVGATLDVSLGGRISARFGDPVPVRGKVTMLTDGRFRNVGPMSTNLEVDLGHTAVLDVDRVKVILTEHCLTPNDPGFLLMHGIDPAKLRLLCVKAKNHFRAAFTPYATTMVDCDSPGPAALSLKHFKFRHVPVALRP